MCHEGIACLGSHWPCGAETEKTVAYHNLLCTPLARLPHRLVLIKSSNRYPHWASQASSCADEDLGGRIVALRHIIKQIDEVVVAEQRAQSQESTLGYSASVQAVSSKAESDTAFR